jgi:hypothetical protein
LIGFWADVVVRFSDDASITVTSAPRGHEIDSCPGHDKLYLAGDPLERLLERTASEQAGRPALPVSPGDFVAVFEKAYADTMAWRKSRGGVTAEEVARVDAEMKKQRAATGYGGS